MRGAGGRGSVVTGDGEGGGQAGGRPAECAAVRGPAGRVRGARGRYSISSVYGKGVSQPVTRTGGASRCKKAFSLMSATSSAPKPTDLGASCTTTTRPVFFTLAITVSMSSGQS